MNRNSAIVCIIIIIIMLFTGCRADVREAAGSIAVSEGQSTSADSGEDKVNGIPVNDKAAVVTEMTADVFAGQDVKSGRITQVFYNQLVSVLDENEAWSRIITADGNTGWVRSKFIDRDISSISGRVYMHKIIVTSRDKSIFSDPSGGITVKDAVMGSVFNVFNNSGDAYEVYLPGKKTGWLRGSGIIHISPGDSVPVTTGKDFAASALKFKGTCYLLNGLSSMGIDSAGMIYICAKVNGLEIPRDLKGQMGYGRKIALDEIIAGDVVFLGETEDENTAADAGICLGNGQYIHASRTLGYVILDGLNESGSDGKPVFARRIFR